MIVTGKRLKSKLDFQPSAKFSYHELVSNISRATLSLNITLSCKKLTQRMALLRKIIVYLPLRQRLSYYNSIIHPIITYASVIWSRCDKESLNRVLKLQKRGARVILSAYRDSPPVQLSNKLKMDSFL